MAASAVGIYGDPGETEVDEAHPAGDSDRFLVDVCEQWEAENMRLAHECGTRVVLLRIGIVLGKDGGALEKLIPMFRWGLGGKLGNGQQWMPWIHVHDLAAMIGWAIETDSVSGPLNGTAPHPVRNTDFTKSLASAVGRLAILPAPRFGLRLALGEFADSLLVSQKVVPTKANESGFQFAFPQLDEALKDIVKT